MIYVSYETYITLWFTLGVLWFLFACAMIMDGILEDHAEDMRYLAQWQKDYNSIK